MIVYGDAERIEDAEAIRGAVIRALLALESLPAGLERHSALVSAFIRAGELFQGIADAEFHDRGFDISSPKQETGALVLLELARAIDRSWSNGFRAEIGTALYLMEKIDNVGPVRTRTCEGYAHYALYPESYLAAARHSRLNGQCRVIGIRSIGLGLSAIVAAALDARPPISLRPVGCPFAREIKADANLIALDAADPAVHFAIVDEGPGLSGSSFAAVARWLFAHGVEAGRVHFFPSHGGEPGPEASTETRAVWSAVRRHPASDFDVVDSPRGISEWVNDLVGPLREPLREITTCFAGLNGRDAELAPDTRFVRRKFLAAGKRSWIAKFAGLGAVGERKWSDAAALANAGLAPNIAGFRHGFIVQEWVEAKSSSGTDRQRMLHHIGRYLAFRSRRLGPPSEGASLETLKEMGVVNTRESLGVAAASGLEAYLAARPVAQPTVRPMRTDNRLHTWEWLRTDAGILKLDAVDHCEAHDLIGCQDIAWDIAGAVVEHDLLPAEISDLRALIRANGGPVTDDALIEVMLPCYLAFQIGLWSTAAAVDEMAAAIQRKHAARYTRRLARLLGAAGSEAAA